MTLPAVAFICNEYPPAPHGGIGTFTQVVGEALVKAGHRVLAIGIGPQSSGDRKVEKAGGVEIHRLSAVRPDVLSALTRAKLYRYISQLVRSGAIDLVEVPDFEGWAAGWPVLPVPVVARVHGSGTYFRRELSKPDTLRSRMAEKVEGASMRRVDSWCAVSEYAGNRTAGIFGLRPPDAINYNPVQLPAMSPNAERSRTRVVFTGTLTYKKGIQTLIRAWNFVAAAHPAAELHIYGKDTSGMQPALREQLQRDARGSVHFHGHTLRPAVLAALAGARVAVFPSWAEAFAFAPLEAMAVGCPTISSTRTSGPEAIQHGRDGLLVDPASPEETANAILRILRDDDLATAFGQAGRERVARQFSMEVALPAIQNFYADAILRFRRDGAAAAVGARTAA